MHDKEAIRESAPETGLLHFYASLHAREHLGLHLGLANLCITPLVHFHRTCGKSFEGTHNFFKFGEHTVHYIYGWLNKGLYEGKINKCQPHDM